MTDNSLNAAITPLTEGVDPGPEKLPEPEWIEPPSKDYWDTGPVINAFTECLLKDEGEFDLEFARKKMIETEEKILRDYR
jgi:hypothetical protein